MTIYKSKNYENFSRYLKRALKLECGHSLAYLLIEKFTKTDKPTRPQKLWLEDLKKRKMISNSGNSFKNFKHFRDIMTSKQILICMATSDECADEEANHKANLFRYGPAIKKYIEIELEQQSSVFERLDTKADEIKVTERFEKLEKKVENLTALILKFAPPDDEVRRNIVERNADDYDKMKKLLDEDLKRRQAMI